MSEIRDLSPEDRVDRIDRGIVKGARIAVYAILLVAGALALMALAEAGWMAWATVGICIAIGAAIGILLTVFALLVG
jgi:hypothetical protein